ncbi:MAG: thiamine phosphate synthase [Gammaproteobacteria bacterium]|nr:thiamine phosphate synthase [Gammaproteobacteria bacterium]MBT5116864.1 thiamine phosphate synthase [Gammaproteobacteria bacterium]MBT5761950.1 thiamine phosphate synthase [Gammaproteobacteria bacterium]MBT7322956.1 thiamine phosphate synthase [Gammaproteobacteria bacterium]MDG2158988.1 thiamine phosphate synthase [Gammaproteobacteria bacterium]
MINKNILRGIYPICPDSIQSDLTYLEKVEEVIASGINIIQFRSKYLSGRKKRFLLKSIHRLCMNSNVYLIINDDYHIIKNMDGCGLHLGKNDKSLLEARQNLGDSIVIGKSCYGSVETARLSEVSGASYVSFGAMYDSNTKHNAIVINHKIISEAQKKLNIPICVIGGIDKLNLMDVKKYKPDMISMISGIFEYENPGREIKEMMRLIEE